MSEAPFVGASMPAPDENSSDLIGSTSGKRARHAAAVPTPSPVEMAASWLASWGEADPEVTSELTVHAAQAVALVLSEVTVGRAELTDLVEYASESQNVRRLYLFADLPFGARTVSMADELGVALFWWDEVGSLLPEGTFAHQWTGTVPASAPGAEGPEPTQGRRRAGARRRDPELTPEPQAAPEAPAGREAAATADVWVSVTRPTGPEQSQQPREVAEGAPAATAPAPAAPAASTELPTTVRPTTEPVADRGAVASASDAASASDSSPSEDSPGGKRRAAVPTDHVAAATATDVPATAATAATEVAATAVDDGSGHEVSVGEKVPTSQAREESAAGVRAASQTPTRAVGFEVHVPVLPEAEPGMVDFFTPRKKNAPVASEKSGATAGAPAAPSSTAPTAVPAADLPPAVTPTVEVPTVMKPAAETPATPAVLETPAAPVAPVAQAPAVTLDPPVGAPGVGGAAQQATPAALAHPTPGGLSDEPASAGPAGTAAQHATRDHAIQESVAQESVEEESQISRYLDLLHNRATAHGVGSARRARPVHDEAGAADASPPAPSAAPLGRRFADPTRQVAGGPDRAARAAATMPSGPIEGLTPDMIFPRQQDAPALEKLSSGDTTSRDATATDTAVETGTVPQATGEPSTSGEPEAPAERGVRGWFARRQHKAGAEAEKPSATPQRSYQMRRTLEARRVMLETGLPPVTDYPEALDYLRAGDRARAIAVYRKGAEVGLVEAIDAIDALGGQY